ncbi:putative ribosomal protein S10 [Medicago truncatula]|uniref:30S ribosomal protein S10 n=1 Tax=Medicago truncatula TaxID=3880 RepID=I3SWS9_MEDTR|nr:cyanelle 30S ribosomal protein S10 [Medicago truncatula]AFK44721.1 unknown [Medicago truncatula]KEH34027.1 30S ribosomal protein S10 [Medicago truncatula]RHN67356.1 putative ribosomal protein S10 [Medicago truncatula]
MAVSSLSATFIPSLSLSSNSSPLLSSKLKLQSLCFVSGNTLRITNAKPLQLSTVVHAAPEVLNSEVDDLETPSTSEISIGDNADMLAPKHKIRIKLRSYLVPLIEDSCKQILDAARTTNAKTMGPVPLPTKKRIHCVLKSPHVHKDARFHFEVRTHQRVIDILFPTAQTIDSLMLLQLPAGVDVEVKL